MDEPLRAKALRLKEEKEMEGLMARVIYTDIKLLAAGAGVGALVCAAFAGQPASHLCGLVALIAVAIAIAARQAAEGL